MKRGAEVTNGRYCQIPWAICLHVRVKAILFQIGEIEVWIPRSQIQYADQVDIDGYQGPIVVTRWWVEISGNKELLDWEATHEVHPNGLERANKVYRKCAAKYHPDRSPGTAEVMKDFNELWQAVQADYRSRR